MLIATTNPGKVREIRRVLRGMSGIVELGTLPDRLSIPEPKETGHTFAENAALKARVYAAATGLTTVAEDSGLIIDALGGRPGVQSARYPGATYPDKFRGLYAELAGKPRPWTARFVCALACVEKPQATPLEIAFACEGIIEGEIAAEPRGKFGFGYDPIFFYPPLRMTTGEMPDEQKLTVSHRGQAFRQFREWIEESMR